MNIVKTIKKLLNEAELYQTQGLLNEARSSYLKAAALIKTSDQLKNSQNLLDGIKRKIKALTKDVKKFDNSPVTPEVTIEKQDMIKNLFAFPSDPGSSQAASIDLDGSIILAKFGQYERAMEEFRSLLKEKSVRVVAAKNLLRCHIAISSIDEAIRQYKEWAAGDLFTPEQMEKVTFFMKGLAKKHGRKFTPATKKKETTRPKAADREKAAEKKKRGVKAAPKPKKKKVAVPEKPKEAPVEEEIIDISSIGITPKKGPRKDQLIELDVSFQTGNVISLLISGKDEELLSLFEKGALLQQIQFYSPIAMFQGQGTVQAKTKISSGPKSGDYSVDIKITST